MKNLWLVAFIFALIGTVVPTSAMAQVASLAPARPTTCPASASTCEQYDALVFVHGIYGDKSTFVNPSTNFNWPQQLPNRYRDRPVDVFVLSYQTELLAWLRQTNPKFDQVVLAAYEALKPLRMRQYRSIGFVAHSLGGNVVSAYISYVKSKRSHPGSSQHAYVITLATPVLGSQLADLGTVIKNALGFSADPLLDSLRRDNQLLRMLLEFRKAEGDKRELYGCRPISLHAAYEEKQVGPFMVVTRDSAETSVSGLTSSAVVGFRLDHFSIVKPTDRQHEVYQWVNARIDEEFVKLSAWSKAVALHPPLRRMCTDIDYKPEA